jgi:hypothetical protein
MVDMPLSWLNVEKRLPAGREKEPGKRAPVAH